jgi:hypothetical protein
MDTGHTFQLFEFFDLFQRKPDTFLWLVFLRWNRSKNSKS